MIKFNEVTKPVEDDFLVSFADITNFGLLVKNMSNTETFDLLKWFYELIGEQVEKSGGYVIKFIGDSALIIYNKEDVDKGIKALYEMKKFIDKEFEKKNYDSKLGINAHIGKATLGKLGGIGSLDIIGDTVNTTSLLNNNTYIKGGFIISVKAYRSLNDETRQLFNKFNLPIVYTAD